MENGKPKLTRVVTSDYASVLAILFPIALLVIWILTRFFGLRETPRGGAPLEPKQVLRDAAWVAVIGAILLIVGLLRFRRLFAVGVRVPGTVTSLLSWRHGESVAFAYEFQGTRFGKTNVLNTTDRTSSLKQGVEITVLLDPSRPRRAIILEYV